MEELEVALDWNKCKLQSLFDYISAVLIVCFKIIVVDPT